MKSAKQTNLKNAPKDAASFTIRVHVGGEVGPYKAEDVLSTAKHIADYFRLHAETDTVNGATDAQINAVVQATDVTGMSDEDANLARLDAVTNAAFDTHGADDIPSVARLAMSGANADLAIKYGQMVSDKVSNALTKAIEAEKDKDAGPVLTAYTLEEQFKGVVVNGGTPFFDTVPPIGTRYQKGKSDRSPYGYRNPNDTTSTLPIYNGPWDYSLTENRSGYGPAEIKDHWVGNFVGAKMGKMWAERVDHIRALLKTDAKKADCPEDLLAIAGSKVKLQAELDEASFQFNRRVRIVSNAFKLIQRKAEIAERFKGINVELIGMLEFNETEQEASRRRKPFTLTSQRQLPDGRLTTDKSPPVAMSRVLNMEPRKFPENSTVSTLLTVKRGTKAGAEANKVQPGALATEIQTTDKLEEYLSAVANYIDDGQRWNSVMTKVREPKDGGQLAAAIVRTHADLSSLAQNADVQKLARQYEENAARALAMANTAGNGNGKDTKAA